MELRHSSLRTAMQRMGSGKRWWAAEIVLRSFGVLLLAWCALAAWRLHASILRPAQSGHLRDYPIAALAVVCWWFGWAFVAEGPGLFKLVPVPGRRWISEENRL